jgi:hypothetical protein
MKVAMDSTVVIDTPQAPMINGFVKAMWMHQAEASGGGFHKAIRVFDRIEDIPGGRSSKEPRDD